MKEMLKNAVPLVNAWLNPLHIKFDRERNRKMLKEAKGILIVRLYKASLGIGLGGGYGLVIAKLEDGTWSGPTAVSVSGLSFGFQVGAAETHFIGTLSRRSVQDFYESKSFSVGSSFGASVFFMGRSAEGMQSTNNRKSSLAQISKQRGFFTGFALEGKRFKTYNSANREYYNLTETSQQIFPWQILLGKTHIPKNRNYAKLIKLLQKYSLTPEKQDDSVEEEKEKKEEKNVKVEEQIIDDKKTLEKRIVVQQINLEQKQHFINPFFSDTAEYVTFS